MDTITNVNVDFGALRLKSRNIHQTLKTYIFAIEGNEYLVNSYKHNVRECRVYCPDLFKDYFYCRSIEELQCVLANAYYDKKGQAAIAELPRYKAAEAWNKLITNIKDSQFKQLKTMKKQYFYLLMVVWALLITYTAEQVISEHQIRIEIKTKKIKIKALQHQIDSLRHDSLQRAFDRRYYIAGTAEIPNVPHNRSSYLDLREYMLKMPGQTWYKVKKDTLDVQYVNDTVSVHFKHKKR